MLRKTVLPLFFALAILSGCLSPQAREQIAGLNRQVAGLKAQLSAAELAKAPEVETIRAALVKAEAELAAVKSAAKSERFSSGLDIAENAIGGIQPIVLGLFPALGPAFGLLAGALALARKVWPSKAGGIGV